MNPYLSRSRISKALTDSGLAGSFGEAESRLDAVRPCVLLGESVAATPAGQYAALTAVATMRKCFGNALLVIPFDTPLGQPLPVGRTLAEVALGFGATVSGSIDGGITHLVRIGDARPWQGWQVSCWWDRWLSGTRLVDVPCGSSSLAPAGIFAGALATRQVFGNLLSGTPPREAAVSLWEPAREASPGRSGPKRFVMPNELWLVGLGHLGQGFVWSLSSLALGGARLAVLQDDQWIEPENEPTSILATGHDVAERCRKVRLAARWLEHSGWVTQLIERRHRGDIALLDNDPPILLSGLDDVRPRRLLAAQKFDYMIDAGIGRGPRDFEGIQIRTIPGGSDPARLWLDEPEDAARRKRLLARAAYSALEHDIGQCGVVPLADASVSVPFVGAATGALVAGQLARLGEMRPAVSLLQMELNAPEMIIDGGVADGPESFLGGETIVLD